MKIKLGNELKSNSRILSGREEGKKARKKYNIDTLDNNQDEISIEIPSNTLALNSSFFLGMFDQSVLLLGEEKFKQKYKFKCESEIRESIEDGINRALKNSSFFGESN